MSFRGPDTRRGFTDCLYHRLKRKGIHVFRDNEDLPVGGKINPSLTEAVKRSEIGIPIISMNYASSKSCLTELQQMLECKENNEQMIIPIFYDVCISDVKHLTGSFGKSFYKYVKKKGVGRERMDAWKKALQEIGEIRGFSLAEMNDGHHDKLIELVVSEVSRRLKKRDLVVTEYLVGIDRHVENIMRKLDVDFRNGQAVETIGSERCVIGICGIPGIGKTTLAKVVYNKLNHLFEGCAYLENVQERSTQVEGLKTLLSSLVSQLENRSQEFLTSDDAMYVIRYRFRRDKVLIFLDDVGNSEQLTQIAGDLSGYGRGSRIIVTSRRQDVLMNVRVTAQTYELEAMKELGLMFVDDTNVCFACKAFDYLCNLKFLNLDSANVEDDVNNLLSNLRCLHWQICTEKTLKTPFFSVENLIILDLSWSRVNQDWRSWEQIGEKAKKLKVLNLTGCHELLESPEFRAPIELERLILECCSKLSLISPSISNLSCLVSLNMKCSNVDQLPDLGFMKALKELVIDGTLIDMIRFQKGSVDQLETLSACMCARLEQIYGIDHLRSLSNLALDGAAIKTLPVSIGSLVKLQCLSLRNCQKLTEIPRSTGKLKDLQFMDLSNTGVDELPYSVKHLENLKVLKMEGTRIKEIPEAMQCLPKLEEIDFSLCRNLEIQMDSDLAGLSSLRVLKLSYTQIPHLPESVCCLLNLQMVDLRYCKKLQALPKFRSSVIILR